MRIKVAKIKLNVHGRVGGSGSKTVFRTKQASGKMSFNVTPASKYQKPWMESVKWAFLQKYSQHFMPYDGAIVFQATFYLPRPKGHFKKNGELSKEGHRHPLPDRRSAPDLDKAVRATKDALSGLVYKDDKLVVEQHAYWRWRDQPGADISVGSLQEKTQRVALKHFGKFAKTNFS